MTDIIDRAQSVIRAISEARAHGISQAIPDGTVANLLTELVTEVRAWRSIALTLGATVPSELLFKRVDR